MKPVYQPFLISIRLSQTSTFQSVDRCSFVHEKEKGIRTYMLYAYLCPIHFQPKPNHIPFLHLVRTTENSALDRQCIRFFLVI